MRKRPCDPNIVTVRSPSMTYCHSSALGCQCNSRSAPGSRSRMTPVIVVDPGDCRRDWKPGGIDAPFATAVEDAVRRVGKHPELMSLWRRHARSLEIFRYLLRWNGTAREINFLLWKTIKR